MTARIYTALRRFNDDLDARFNETEQAVWEATVHALEEFRP